jgi:hypothetical protein
VRAKTRIAAEFERGEKVAQEMEQAQWSPTVKALAQLPAAGATMAKKRRRNK